MEDRNANALRDAAGPAPSERAARVRRLFDELLDLPPEARAAHLDEACGRDASLRREVASLLDAYAGADEVLQRLDAPPLDDPSLPPDPFLGRRVAHYEILERLGAGGMGVVYRARDERLGRTVALKFLPASFTRAAAAKERFLREARAASALDHPNLCTIHEIRETDEGQLYIVMACYEGETLQQRIARGPLPVPEALDLATQIAAGLAHAHAHGVVHRDVKPSNVMVTREGVAKLLDFGLAKVADAELTGTGVVLGTPAYMSPEQAGAAAVDHRTDVWSLGVVVFEMLTGERPFKGRTAWALLSALQDASPPPVQAIRPDVPAPLAQAVDQALQKDPAGRHPTMRALHEALHRIQQDARFSAGGPAEEPPFHVQSPVSSRVSPSGTMDTPRRRRPARFAALAGVLFLAGLYLWLQGGSEPPPPVPENSIAVLYFENLTGDPSLDWIGAGMVEMLTANLGRFERVEVLSSQRLFDIMKQVSGDDVRINRRTATEIARRAGVHTMLLGSVLGSEAHLRLNTQLVEVSTGALLGSEVIDTGPGGSLFALADSLTQRIATRLAIQPPDRPAEAHVAYTLTNSPEALRHYVEGVQALYRANHTRAIMQFNAAVAADSTFAMAYYHRELAHSWQTGMSDREALEKALRYGDRISARERALIAATFTMLEDLPTRKRAFEQFVEQYPDEKYAWNQLGEIRYHNYWPRGAVAAFERATELDPHFLVAYIHPVDFAFHTDAYARAAPLIDQVLALDSAKAEFRLNRAYLRYATGGGDEARNDLVRLLQRMARDTTLTPKATLDAKAGLAMLTKDFAPLETALRTFRRQGHFGTEGYALATNSLAGLALLQGRVHAAAEHLAEARRRDPESPALLYETGLFELLRGQAAAARATARDILRLHERGTEPFAEVATLGWHLLFRAHLAEDDPESARRALAELEALQAESEYGFLYDDARGRLACHQGDTERARRHFAQARSGLSYTGSATGVVVLFSRLLLDAELACLERAGAHAALLQRAAEAPLFAYHYHVYNPSTMAVWLRTRLREARAYEALGQTPEAVAAYEEVLALWEDPDEDVLALRDARERLARLTAPSTRPGT